MVGRVSCPVSRGTKAKSMVMELPGMMLNSLLPGPDAKKCGLSSSDMLRSSATVELLLTTTLS